MQGRVTKNEAVLASRASDVSEATLSQYFLRNCLPCDVTLQEPRHASMIAFLSILSPAPPKMPNHTKV